MRTRIINQSINLEYTTITIRFYLDNDYFEKITNTMEIRFQ